MSRMRRLLGWAVFLGLLSAVGVVVFHIVRHAPRCTIAGPLVFEHLSADGSRLVTLQPKGDHVRRGPLQVWDTHRGRVVHEWFHDTDVPRFSHSPDDRHGAIVLGDGRLRIVDWQTGKEWRFDEPPNDEAVNRADFSPGGRWLFVVTASGRTLYLIDVNTCQVVLRMKDNWPVISADDRLVFYRQGPGNAITVRDLPEDKTLGVLALTANQFDLSADGRLLLERHSEPIPAPPEEPGQGLFKGTGGRKIERKDFRVSVWDLASFTRRFDHQLARAGYLQAVLSPDSRTLAMWLQDDSRDSNLDLVDTATGKLLWSYPMTHASHFDFSPDGSLCYLVRGPDEKNSMLALFDVISGRSHWQTRDSGWALTRFVGTTGILIHQEDIAKPLLFRDVRTGEAMAIAPRDFRTANCMPMMTRDARSYIICGWQERQREPFFWETWLEKRWPELFGDGLEGALVVEAATGRELFRVVNHGKLAHELSDDGSTLVTVDAVPGPQKTMLVRIWDVRPTRAWLWAVGTAATTGFGLLALRWLWRKRKARKSARNPKPLPSASA